MGVLVEEAFWWRGCFEEGAFSWQGCFGEGVFWWLLGRGGVLVEVVLWCWLKGRFGGASLLMDGGGVLVEGAFWCRGRFGGRGVSVEEVCW